MVTNEVSRLATLRACQILDTPPEKAFDDLVRLAAMICGTPMGVISFVDEDRLWLKAVVGSLERSLPRRASFCDQAIHSAALSIVADAARDARFAGHPLVTLGVRFYAGAPLVVGPRCAIGTLAVLAPETRELNAQQREAPVSYTHLTLPTILRV